MAPADLRLRNETYRLFVTFGRAPTAVEVADALGATEDVVLDGWRRLHTGHALVLNDDDATIRMANPFSGVPTPFRVHAGGREWFANCAWDAFGVCAALHVDGRIETVCADCGDPLGVEVRDMRPDDPSLLFHSLVPARRWWEDIVFTQRAMNLFRSEEHVRRWLGDREPGMTLPVATLAALAEAWWGDRLAPDWAPHSRAQNQAILDGLGLTDEFWTLP